MERMPESATKTYPLPPANKDEVVLAGGGVNPELTQNVADLLEIHVAPVSRKRHGNGELDAHFEESVRGKDVYIIQSHASANGYTITEAVFEHQMLVQAASGSDANSVTAIAPYLGYSRGERKSRGRQAVPAILTIENYENAGRKSPKFRMLSVDLHAPQTSEHLRTGPYEHLIAQEELRYAVVKNLGSEAVKNCVVVSPDAGAMKRTKRHAEEFSGIAGRKVRPLFIDKERSSDDTEDIQREADEVLAKIVEGRICLTFDDMIASGGTSVTAAEHLKSYGAEAVIVAGVHATFTDKTVDNLKNPAVDKIFVTDSLPTEEAKLELGEKLQVVRIAPLIERAIYEIQTKGSISSIFDSDPNYS